MLQLWTARAARPLMSVFTQTSTRCFSTDGFATDMSNIGPTEGSVRQQNRVGRGPGSGRGKTSGRGQKGQHARAGVKFWFEGGQVPLYLRFPKFGFRSKIYKPVEVNLGDIQALINSGKIDSSKPITMKELRAAGISSGSDYGIKILGRGSGFFTAQVDISATRATKEAIDRIEELGGKFTSQYYTPLGFRALSRPEATLEKWARIPLRARPISRRAIEYYRNPEARGYLVDAPGAPVTSKLKVTFAPKKGELVALMEKLEQGDASAAAVEGFNKNTSLKTAVSA